MKKNASKTAQKNGKKRKLYLQKMRSNYHCYRHLRKNVFTCFGLGKM